MRSIRRNLLDGNWALDWVLIQRQEAGKGAGLVCRRHTGDGRDGEVPTEARARRDGDAGGWLDPAEPGDGTGAGLVRWPLVVLEPRIALRQLASRTTLSDPPPHAHHALHSFDTV